MFSDATGRRWRRTLVVSGVLAMVATLGFLLSEPLLLGSPLRPSGGRGVSAAQVGADPVTVGSGPLIRVAKVVGRTLVDPWSDQQVGTLSKEQQEEVRSSRYVLQSYGYVTGGKGPSLSLTFDDGPSAVWTRQVLDVLAQYHAQATFFVTGTNLVTHPEFARRAEREGHLVANHSVRHEHLADIRSWKRRWELVTNDRAIRAVIGKGSAYVRLPYDGDEGLNFVTSVIAAQREGYAVSTYDFDSGDWHHVKDPGAIPLPPLNGKNLTVLVHDAGGDRSATVAYLKKLLPAAKAAGYTFTTLATSQPVAAQSDAASQPVTRLDQLAALQLRLQYAWPNSILRALFLLAVLSVAGIGLFQMLLGVIRYRRRQRRIDGLRYDQPVDVMIAAYNEVEVIRRTLRSVLASRHPIHQLIVVDDGSTDGTSEEVRAVAAKDSRVRLVQQPNGGKSSAQNHGLTLATTEVVVTLDADTIIAPDTIPNLVRHFGAEDADRLGAVAGTVRVGNRTRNLLTRWQALEYVAQIGIERSAQDLLGAISIIPGACAAWRRAAILEAGGYSQDTLAEDCDLSLSLHQKRYRVTQDDQAVARTEAPDTVDALLKQRTRWMYGTIQAVVKHRNMLFNRRFGWLGMFVMPAYILSLVVPLVFLPVVTVMTLLLIQSDGVGSVMPYFLSFLGVQMIITAVGIRMMGESWRHLWMVPIYRVVFEPLRAYLIYVSFGTALKGVGLSWNKLSRTGFLDAVDTEIDLLELDPAARPQRHAMAGVGGGSS